MNFSLHFRTTDTDYLQTHFYKKKNYPSLKVFRMYKTKFSTNKKLGRTSLKSKYQ